MSHTRVTLIMTRLCQKNGEVRDS
ncbi:hypothetical protein SBRY_30898 [Actinacidiphila bryophytorum]|uniref:Uncharacterized protein n=1 Tax=Actinacidiphila bryophytorum TaxID=1436133 RepID=A0A9W4H1V9_9ACTN|nr:hypothetical protein SBRY_30898 [Actinacidiphila bryophytorum]